MNNLKYVVYCTVGINTIIRGENLRGEGRWERNVLDALISAGREVYLTDMKRFWRSPNPPPPNLHCYSELTDLTNTVFLGHAPPMRMDIPVKCHRYILQWFNGPDDNAHGEFLDLVAKNPGSVIATYNYLLKAKQYESKLHPQNTRCIQGPAIPHTFNTDNFDKPYLLWSSKQLWEWMRTPSLHPFLIGLFDWVRVILEKNPSTRLAFLLGTMGNMQNKEEVAKWFWNSPVSGPLQHLKSRLDIFYQIEWTDVFKVLEQTKLIMNPHLGYGGPPWEAGAFGIPIILTANGHPFHTVNKDLQFPQVIQIDEHYPLDVLVPVLNRLYSDRDFYTDVGNAYRRHTTNWGTYDAYIRQLDQVCKEYGWM